MSLCRQSPALHPSHNLKQHAVLRSPQCVTSTPILGNDGEPLLLTSHTTLNAHPRNSTNAQNSAAPSQRDKKGTPILGDDGKPLLLTSHTLASVPVFIGGAGLPNTVVFRDDLPAAGLANITATSINLLGYEAPSVYEPSLLVVK